MGGTVRTQRAGQVVLNFGICGSVLLAELQFAGGLLVGFKDAVVGEAEGLASIATFIGKTVKFSLKIFPRMTLDS